MFISKLHQHSSFLITCAILFQSSMVGCGPSPEVLAAVYYAPLHGDDWDVSTPEQQGLDSDFVAKESKNTTPELTYAD